MQDIFDQRIMCNECNIETRKNYMLKEGFKMRVLKCPQCDNVIPHPLDYKEYESYKKLKAQDFNVKLRMVGNSFCVSIPKELLDFHRNFEKDLNELVKLNLDQPGKITMVFMTRKVYKTKNQDI